ncbi:hypothetical protein ES703_17463 [subsurface metagenome]
MQYSSSSTGFPSSPVFRASLGQASTQTMQSSGHLDTSTSVTPSKGLSTSMRAYGQAVTQRLQ